MRRTIRVILAEENHLLREGIRALLERQSDMKVVGEAADGRAALDVVLRKRPDVVLINPMLPVLSGIEVIRELASMGCRTRAICVSAQASPRIVGSALHAGAAGYISKEFTVSRAVEAIRDVAAGGGALSPHVARDVVSHFVREPSAAAHGRGSTLTARQRQVLQLIAEGLSAKEVARQLNISHKRVLAHRAHIMEALGLQTDVQLSRYALQHELTTL